MSANPIDVLVFIPLIPVIPFGWLPWERWIPDKAFSKIIGPYLLYCAFAVWHFKLSVWGVWTIGLMGVAFSAVPVFELRKARMGKQARERRAKMLKEAQDWPVADGFVYYTGQSRDVDGVRRVTLTYTYKVHKEGFVGSESFPFTSEEDAERLESGCKGGKVRVHYRPDKPEICVLDPDGVK